MVVGIWNIYLNDISGWHMLIIIYYSLISRDYPWNQGLSLESKVLSSLRRPCCPLVAQGSVLAPCCPINYFTIRDLWFEYSNGIDMKKIVKIVST